MKKLYNQLLCESDFYINDQQITDMFKTYISYYYLHARLI